MALEATAESMSTAKRQALHDLNVVELSRDIPGAWCARMLADCGAHVTTVEPPAGNSLRRRGPFPGDVPNPEASGVYLAANLGKRGVTLNVDTNRGRELFLDLVREADVLVEDHTPRVMEERGLDHDHLKEINPRLIVTSITPFGSTGPWRDYNATHLTTAAACGLAMGLGHPDREPLTMPFDLVAYQAGAAGYSATMLALVARESSGVGEHVDVSATDTIATLYSIAITTLLYRGITLLRNGNHGSFLYPDVFLPCKDGYIGLVCNQIAQWIRFLELMGTPKWTEERRYRDRRAMTESYPDEVDDLLIAWLKEHTREELFQMCVERDVPLTPAYTVKELLDLPHLQERGFWVPVDHPQAGTLKFTGPNFEMTGTPLSVKGRAPQLGEHNVEILGESLGVANEELERLRTVGVV